MTITEGVTRSIFSAIDEVNQLLPKETQLEKSLNTILSGDEAKLDSIGLVNFIVVVEEKIEEELCVTITLTDDGAMQQSDNPFKTIGSLIDYLRVYLKDKTNG